VITRRARGAEARRELGGVRDHFAGGVRLCRHRRDAALQVNQHQRGGGGVQGGDGHGVGLSSIVSCSV